MNNKRGGSCNRSFLSNKDQVFRNGLLLQVWDFVRGIGSKIRPISCAASASMEVRGQDGTTDHGVAMLEKMFSCLEEV